MHESGDPGSTQPPQPGERRRRGGVSPTLTYTVSAVLVNDVHWVETFERTHALEALVVASFQRRHAACSLVRERYSA
jgi:hypothetical protein